MARRSSRALPSREWALISRMAAMAVWMASVDFSSSPQAARLGSSGGFGLGTYIKDIVRA